MSGAVNWVEFTTECNAPPVANFIAVPDSGTAPLEVEFTDASINSPTSWLWDFNDGTTSTEQNPTHVFEDEGNYDVTLTVSNEAGSDSITKTIYVQSGIGLPGGLLYKPLADEDIDDEFGIFDVRTTSLVEGGDNDILEWQDDDTVIAMSGSPGDLVYAVADGTVHSIRPLDGVYCGGLFYLLGDCLFGFDPGDVTGDDYNLVNHMYRIGRASLYSVFVSFGDFDIIEYIVEDAPNYVHEGLEIEAGCIIGKTTSLLPILPTQLTEIQIGLPPQAVITHPPTTKGVAFLSLFEDGDTDRMPLVEQLTVSVDPGQACNLDPAVGACKWVDPKLQRPDEWDVYGRVQWLSGGGVILDPGASIVAGGLRLNIARAYAMTARVRRPGASGSLVMTLGQTSSDNFVMTMDVDTYVIEPAVHSPDQGSLYSASIENTGLYPIQIDELCISDGENPGAAPSTCYFNNYSFGQDTTGWTTSGTVGPGVVAGSIVMQNNATIGQNAKLYGTGAGSYTYYITIQARVYGDYSTDDLSTVDFTYRYPSSLEGDNGQFSGPNNQYPFPAKNFSLYEGRIATFSAPIHVTGEENGLFLIRLNLDGPIASSGYVEILEVCINDTFAHHPVYGGGRPLITDPTCNRITPPNDESIGSWIFYHWSQLDRFFHCELIIVMNRIFNVVYDIWDFGQWQALYWQAVIDVYVKWLGYDLLPWLNGHLHNIAVGQITTIQTGSGQCDNIFCLGQSLLDLVANFIVDKVNAILNLVSSAVNLLASALGKAFGEAQLTLVNGIINLITTQINILLSLFGQLTSYTSAIINAAATAEPTPIPGLPTCQLNPKSSFACITLWGAENTIFSGRGALIIPLLIGIGSIHLLLWAIWKVRRELYRAAPR